MKELDFRNTRCQETIATSPIGPTQPISCGQPGTTVVWHNNDGKHMYIMCDACARHNINRRRGIELVPKTKIEKTKTEKDLDDISETNLRHGAGA